MPTSTPYSVYLSGGIQQISGAAKDTSWEALRVGLVAPQDGYVQVWVAKESATNVFFDNISVSATSRYLVEELHYNPWGLELEGLTYSNSAYRYNGKEREARTNIFFRRASATPKNTKTYDMEFR